MMWNAYYKRDGGSGGTTAAGRSGASKGAAAQGAGNNAGEPLTTSSLRGMLSGYMASAERPSDFRPRLMESLDTMKYGDSITINGDWVSPMDGITHKDRTTITQVIDPNGSRAWNRVRTVDGRETSDSARYISTFAAANTIIANVGGNTANPEAVTVKRAKRGKGK